MAPVPAAEPSAPDDAGALVSVRDLCIRYPGATSNVVDGVSFDLKPGEVFGLAGESGSGKSTIGHAMLRLLPAGAEVRGRLRIGGIDVLGLGPEPLRQWRWREASIVLQSAMSALNPVLTLGEQFADTLAAHGRGGRASARRRAGELLEMVSLDPQLIDAYPHQLSGGMRQRVGLALALALEPRLVILDEPTTALDVVVQKQLIEQLLALQAKRGFAVLFISHDLPLMMTLATRIGVLRDGRLVEVAPAAELSHPYTRSLLESFPSLPPLEVRP